MQFSDLHLAQFFGIMPLANIRSRDPQDVKFKVKSISTFFTGLFLLLGGIKTLIICNIILNSGLNAKNMSELDNLFQIPCSKKSIRLQLV